MKGLNKIKKKLNVEHKREIHILPIGNNMVCHKYNFLCFYDFTYLEVT